MDKPLVGLSTTSSVYYIHYTCVTLYHFEKTLGKAK